MSNSRPVIPFASRPSRPHGERVARARGRKVADLPRMCVDQNAERPTPAELVYKVSIATHDIVFATPERARYVDSLNDALDSKTWGEFKSRIPADEWKALMECMDEEPSPDKAFEAGVVPGFYDGDWPPWLQQEILQVLPPPVAKKYVHPEMSSINGVFYSIKQSDLRELLRELDARGIHAVYAPKLCFC